MNLMKIFFYTLIIALMIILMIIIYRKSLRGEIPPDNRIGTLGYPIQILGMIVIIIASLKGMNFTKENPNMIFNIASIDYIRLFLGIVLIALGDYFKSFTTKSRNKKKEEEMKK